MSGVKSDYELAAMRRSGAILRDLLLYMQEIVREGITTAYLDAKALEFITLHNAYPSFKGYNGFPGAICVSIDDEVVHGIPGNRFLEEGMLVKVDAGVLLNGYHTDAARTFEIGHVSAEKHKLATVCKECFFVGAEQLKNGARLGDYGATVANYVHMNGYTVVRELSGHGIGKNLHEDPNVFNFGEKGRGRRVSTGMTLALEPMINLGARSVQDDPEDGWTIRTSDGSPSAHYENTVIITDTGVEIITL
ncbi:MAG: type I methionyl aminopeptidase [Christensenellaceae bacterium]|jgi:methionyl aminopeptidase|nr:type I methionyl aminopeptidase [Christensenellaceae bacterium]